MVKMANFIIYIYFTTIKKKAILCAYYVPGTALGCGVIAVNKTREQNPALMKLTF